MATRQRGRSAGTCGARWARPSGTAGTGAPGEAEVTADPRACACRPPHTHRHHPIASSPKSAAGCGRFYRRNARQAAAQQRDGGFAGPPASDRQRGGCERRGGTVHPGTA
ncbi:uncharacterized protein VSU04_014941 isoform 1-T1 [Chlamydotis macqueenii]